MNKTNPIKVPIKINKGLYNKTAPNQNNNEGNKIKNKPAIETTAKTIFNNITIKPTSNDTIQCFVNNFQAEEIDLNSL